MPVICGMIMVLLKQPQRTEHAMPETIPQIRPSFNRSLRLETRPEWLSADTGALVQRELMDRSGLIDWLTERLHDPRHPSSIRYPLSDLLRTRLLLLEAGLARPVRRRPPASGSELAGGEPEPSGHGGPGGGPGAGVTADLVPTVGHAQPGGEPSGPAPGGDRAGLPSDRDARRPEAKTGEKDPTEEETEKDDVPGRWFGLPVEVHGHPLGSEWNGYYRQRMYHGLVASCAETGDLIDGEIFPGASYLGKKALKLTLRVVDHCRGRLCGSMIVRMDAGFPEPGLLKGLESRSVPYIARIRKNEVLNRMAKPYLTQPAGRSPKAPPRLWFHELTYQAESWDRARRVVLVVRERPGELYPDHFWLLTSLSRKRYEAEALLAKYRKRGEGGRPHGRVDGRARSGLVLREPAQDTLSGQTAEAGSQAGTRRRRPGFDPTTKSCSC